MEYLSWPVYIGAVMFFAAWALFIEWRIRHDKWPFHGALRGVAWLTVGMAAASMWVPASMHFFFAGVLLATIVVVLLMSYNSATRIIMGAGVVTAIVAASTMLLVNMPAKSSPVAEPVTPITQSGDSGNDSNTVTIANPAITANDQTVETASAEEAPSVIEVPVVEAGTDDVPLVGAQTVMNDEVVESLGGHQALTVSSLYDPETGLFSGAETHTEMVRAINSIEGPARSQHIQTFDRLSATSAINSDGNNALPSFEDMQRYAAMEEDGVVLSAIVIQNHPNLSDEQARQAILNSPEYQDLEPEWLNKLPVVHREGAVTNTYAPGNGDVSFFQDANKSVRITLGVPANNGKVESIDSAAIEAGYGIYAECGNPTMPSRPVETPEPEPSKTPEPEPTPTPTPEPEPSKTPEPEPTPTPCEFNPNLPEDHPDCLKPKPADPSEWYGNEDDDTPPVEAPPTEDAEETLPTEPNPVDPTEMPGSEITDPEVTIPEPEIPANPDHEESAPPAESPAPVPTDPGTEITDPDAPGVEPEKEDPIPGLDPLPVDSTNPNDEEMTDTTENEMPTDPENVADTTPVDAPPTEDAEETPPGHANASTGGLLLAGIGVAAVLASRQLKGHRKA